ncbi:hypothetical protein OND84_004201 [Morganella morganii]|uniref:hypothetical protein n=1 Tax=Providencia huaxiensis TaxID=2027290 RepID=UPI002ADEA482|nr:hypothetical protein [Morganella morganii]EMB6212883.1 hypothetical protein [Morganella morganii]
MDKTDIQLYLQRQSRSRMLKVTIFIENILLSAVLTPMLIFVGLYGVTYLCAQLVGFGDPEFHRVMELAGYCALGCVGILVLTRLFFYGGLPKFKALLTVSEIELLYTVSKDAYTALNYAPEDERPAIDYLNAVVMSGVPMSAVHTRTVDAMLFQAKKEKDNHDARLKAENNINALTDSIAKTGLMQDTPSLKHRDH